MLYFVHANLSKLAHYVNLEKHTHPHGLYEQAGIKVFNDNALHGGSILQE